MIARQPSFLAASTSAWACGSALIAPDVAVQSGEVERAVAVVGRRASASAWASSSALIAPTWPFPGGEVLARAGAAVVVRRLDVGVGLEQRLDRADVAFLGGEVERAEVVEAPPRRRRGPRAAP